MSNNDWTTIQKKSPTKTKIISDTYNTTLTKYVSEHCIHQLIGKCHGCCGLKHTTDNMFIRAISMFINNPTSINKLRFKRDEISQFLKNDTPIGKYNMNLRMALCLYSSRGLPCKNELEGNIVSFNMGDGIKLNICYPKKEYCKSLVLCGFHIDFDFKYSNLNLVIGDIHYLDFFMNNKTETKVDKKEEIKFENNDFPVLIEVKKTTVKPQQKTFIQLITEKVVVIEKPKVIEKVAVIEKVEENKPKFALVNYFDKLNEDKIEDKSFDENINLNKSSEELKIIVKTLVTRNNKLFERNVELSYVNKILSLPVPKIKKQPDYSSDNEDDEDDADENYEEEEEEYYDNYEDEMIDSY